MQLLNRHVLIVGGSGSGKTTAEVKELVEEAEDGQTAIVCLDPHTGPESLSHRLFAHLCELDLTDRVLYDRLTDLDRVLKWDFLTPSRAKNPRMRRTQNLSRCERFAEILLRRRGQASAKDTPNIEKWLLGALNLYVNQHKRRPLVDIRHALSFNHPTFDLLLKNCTDEETRYLFEDAIEQNSKEYIAAAKIIEGTTRSDSFLVRTSHTGGFNFEQHLNNKGIVIVEGGEGDDLSPDAMRTMMGAIVLKTLSFLRDRKRKYPEVTLVLEEANNADLIGEAGSEINALGELRKFGLGMHILTQYFDFPPKTFSGVFTNCDTRKYFRSTDNATARIIGEDLGGTYDVPSTNTRYQRIKDEYTGDKYLESFEVPSTESKRHSDDVKRLKRGECYNNRRLERITPLPAPFEFLSRKAREALIDGYRNEIRQRPEYYSPDGDNEATASDSPTDNDQTLPNEPPQQPDDDTPFGLF